MISEEITDFPEVTEVSVSVSFPSETETAGYEDIYQAVQSCNATLTVMLAILIVFIVACVSGKILKVLGITDC